MTIDVKISEKTTTPPLKERERKREGERERVRERERELRTYLKCVKRSKFMTDTTYITL